MERERGKERLFRRKGRVFKKKREGGGRRREGRRRREGFGGEEKEGRGDEKKRRQERERANEENKKTPFLVVVAVVDSPGRINSSLYVTTEIYQPPQPAFLCIPLGLNPMASAVCKRGGTVTHPARPRRNGRAATTFVWENLAKVPSCRIDPPTSLVYEGWHGKGRPGGEKKQSPPKAGCARCIDELRISPSYRGQRA